jgi:hypothetical protein
MTANVREQIYNEEISLKNVDADIKTIEKDTLAANFNISKIDPADPEAEDKKNKLEKRIEQNNRQLKIQDDFAKEIKENIQRGKTKIEDIEAGKILVDKDMIADLTREYIREMQKETARNTKVPSNNSSAEETETPQNV